MDRRVQEIEQEIKRDKDQQQQIEMRSLIAELQQQRKNPPSVHHDEEKIAQVRILLAESNKQMVKNELNKICFVYLRVLFSVRISITKYTSSIRRK